MKILSPLFVPIIAFAITLPIAKWFFTPDPDAHVSRNWKFWTTVLCACIAALAPNLGQTLYELGLSFPAIDVVRGASYFVFFLAVAGAWIMIGHTRKRFVLLVLVPVALLEPLKWTFAFACWTAGGFAP